MIYQLDMDNTRIRYAEIIRNWKLDIFARSKKECIQLFKDRQVIFMKNEERPQ